MTVRVTRKVSRLLQYFLDCQAKSLPGTAAGARTYGISPVVFLPAVDQLVADRWLRSEWEIVPHGEVRPRRRLYFLTEMGTAAAKAAVLASNRVSWWKMVKRKGRGEH